MMWGLDSSHSFSLFLVLESVHVFGSIFRANHRDLVVFIPAAGSASAQQH